MNALVAGVLGDFESTDEESYALSIAVAHNCLCQHDPEKICDAHMLLRNVEVIKHMIFVRRLVAGFVLAEFQEKLPE